MDTAHGDSEAPAQRRRKRRGTRLSKSERLAKRAARLGVASSFEGNSVAVSSQCQPRTLAQILELLSEPKHFDQAEKVRRLQNNQVLQRAEASCSDGCGIGRCRERSRWEYHC